MATEVRMVASLLLRMQPELRALLKRKAKEKGKPMSELAVRALAAYLKRPDLGNVPRISWGRPPNDTDEEDSEEEE